MDIVSNWYATNLSEQCEKVKDDPVNELIRDMYESMEYGERTTPGNKKTDTYPNRTDGAVYYDNRNHRIVINQPFALGEENRSRAYVVCSVSGIVYAFGRLDPEGVTISADGFPPGTYLVHLSTAGEPFVHKFIISPE